MKNVFASCIPLYSVGLSQTLEAVQYRTGQGHVPQELCLWLQRRACVCCLQASYRDLLDEFFK